MIIRTPKDLGALLRARRKALDMDQANLAQRIGVSRQWIIGVESGHARAQLGLVLRALDELGIRVSASEVTDSAPPGAPDIDAIVAASRKGAP